MTTTAQAPILLGAPKKRRTKISDSKLLEMFAGKERDPNDAHTSTVATQSTLAGEHFHLNQLILERGPTTTLTTEHAKDRYLLSQTREHRVVDMWIEEQYQRSRLFISHRDGLDLLWKAFLSTVPRNRRAARGSLTSRTESQFGSPVGSDIPSIAFDLLEGSVGNASVVLTGSDVVDLSLVQNENKRLKHKLQTFEKAFRNRAAAGGSAVRKRRTASILGTSGLQQSHGMIGVAAMSALLWEDEVRCRQLTQELELAAFGALVEQHKAEALGLQTRTTKRSLVATPYNAWRPKIPTEHSLAGEEYLRKWILGEIYKHYDDVLSMIQFHENDVRHGIEMEEENKWLPMWRSYIQPHYVKLSEHQAHEIVTLTVSQEHFRHDARNAKVLAKLSMMDESESYGRVLIQNMASEGQANNNEVLGQLESVRTLEVKIGQLAKELQRQRWRHRGEVQTLKAQLPHDGLHPKAVGGSAPFTPHCQPALVKGRGINGREIEPGGAPNVPIGPSFSARYVRQQHAYEASPQDEARRRRDEAMKVVKQVDQTDDWWAGF